MRNKSAHAQAGGRKGEPDEGVVGSEADQRHARQAGDERADKGTTDQGARAEAEEHQAQARGQLIGAPLDHQIGENEIGEHTGESAGDDAQIRVAGHRGRSEAFRGADQHQPLEAEIDDAGAFADQFAERGVVERCPRNDGARQDRFGEGCAHAPLREGMRCPSTMNNTSAISRLMTA